VGNAWLTWKGERLVLADVTVPGHTAEVGERLQRALRSEPPEVRYDDGLRPEDWSPSARVDVLSRLGVDETVVFPNYGLVWERTLGGDLDATRANMGAWNRWAATVAHEGHGRLHPVAHVTMRDLDWLDAQLASLSSAGVRLAMLAPALVDGRPLSHPDHDRAWTAFVHHGITPVFHVANVTRPFGEAWYASDPEPSNPALASVFLWTSPALALADLPLLDARGLGVALLFERRNHRIDAQAKTATLIRHPALDPLGGLLDCALELFARCGAKWILRFNVRGGALGLPGGRGFRRQLGRRVELVAVKRVVDEDVFEHGRYR